MSKFDYDNKGQNYYFCEDLQLMWPMSDVKRLDRLWKEGKSLSDIAEILDRDLDEVAIAVIDRKRRGRIGKRKNGYMGGK